MQQSSGGGPKPSFQISLTWLVSTTVRGVEIQSLVQYWIKTVCCRTKDHFHWTVPLYPTVHPCTPLVQKVGIHCPHTPPAAPPMRGSEKASRTLWGEMASFKHSQWRRSHVMGAVIKPGCSNRKSPDVNRCTQVGYSVQYVISLFGLVAETKDWDQSFIWRVKIQLRS